jgi:NADH-quinone oxidoreductase subunit N
LLSSFGSLFIGSFGIIGQNRIKRLMAFSSINHVSFLLLGMACGTLSGLVTTLLYLIVYSLTLFFFFLYFIKYQLFNYRKIFNLFKWFC